MNTFPNVRAIASAGLVALVLLGVPRSAHAEDVMTFRYERTQDVQPDARLATEILQRRVKTVSASATENEQQVGVIRVETRESECIAFAQLTKPPLEGERLMRAPTCEQALEALGVSLSVLLNEQAVAAPAAAAVEAPPAETPAPASPREEPPSNPLPKERVGLGIRGGADRGYVPAQDMGFGGAIEIFGRFEFERLWELEVGWRRQLGGDIRLPSTGVTHAGINGEFSTQSAVGRLCRLSTAAERVLVTRGCARVEIVDQGFSRTADSPSSPYNSTASGDHTTSVWPALGIEGGVRLNGAGTHAGPYLELNVAATAAPLRPRWVVDDGRQVFRPDLIQLSASLGAGFRF